MSRSVTYSVAGLVLVTTINYSFTCGSTSIPKFNLVQENLTLILCKATINNLFYSIELNPLTKQTL